MKNSINIQELNELSTGDLQQEGGDRSRISGHERHLFSPQQRILLWLACSAIFFEAFDVSIVNLAIPVIAADLRISLAATQWVQTVYLLSFGGFLLLGGRLCDYAGSKRIFMAGMFLFGTASAIALVSHHISLLLLARAAQGIGAALAMPGGISLLARHFEEGPQRQTAIGIFGAFAAVGFAGGLALGGLIASFFNWHWIFGVNVPVIAGVLIAGYYCIPEESIKKTAPLNWLTAVWLTTTLLLFCYSIHELTSLGWGVIPCLFIALVSGAALRRYDRRQELPFFPDDLFVTTTVPLGKQAGTSSAVPASPRALLLTPFRTLAASFLLGACFLSFVFLCTLSLYEEMHWDIRSTGLLLFPYSIGSALVSKFLLPWLFRRMKVVQVGRLAMLNLLVGVLLLMAGISTHQLAWFLVALFLVNSVSIAIGYPAFTILSLSGVPAVRQGIAAGLQSATYSVGTGMGLSVIGLCLQSFSPNPAGTHPGLPVAGVGPEVMGGLCMAGAVIAAGCITALFLLVGPKGRMN